MAPSKSKTLSEEEIKEMVNNQFSTFISLVTSGQIILPGQNQPTEEERLANLDRNYRPPPFIVPNFQENEKLVGYKNFKLWKITLERNLEALMLLPFIQSDGGQSVNVSQARRDVLNAQSLQVLIASLSKSNQYLIQQCRSAFEAFNILNKTYSTTRMRDYVHLNNKFMFIKFRPGYDPVRFVTDYENCLEEFSAMGCSFPDEFVVSMFLFKIIGITDPKTIYFSYFNNFASKTEMPTFNEVKDSFLQLDHEAAAKQATSAGSSTSDLKNKGEKRKRDNDTHHEPKSKFRKCENEKAPSTTTAEKSEKLLYTAEQVKQLRTLSAEEKKKIQCTKCGEYFHSAEKCDRPGPKCFNCHEYGHKSFDCKLPKRKPESKNGK